MKDVTHAPFFQDLCTRRLVLCADDFGQNRAISQGILDLARKGRLSALSCMVDGPFFRTFANELKEIHACVDIGLHFNLTHPYGFAERPLGYWIKMALARKIDCADVKNRLERQLLGFEAVLGYRPDFVDGHQHVHVFPGIRKAFFQARPEQAYTRSLRPFCGPTNAPIKRVFLRCLSSGFRRHLGTFCNTAFFGDYALKTPFDYQEFFTSFLRGSPRDGTLVMVHPAAASTPEERLQDPLWKTRENEYHFLASSSFEDLLNTYGFSLALGRELYVQDMPQLAF